MNAQSPVAKPLSTNPLKSSAPLGAAMAYLGVEGAVPLFHGSQRGFQLGQALQCLHQRLLALVLQTA